MTTENEYPRMLYGPHGQTRVVNSADAEHEAGADWKRVPADEHRQPQQLVTIPATPAGQDPFVTAVVDALTQRLQLLGLIPKDAAAHPAAPAAHAAPPPPPPPKAPPVQEKK